MLRRLSALIAVLAIIVATGVGAAWWAKNRTATPGPGAAAVLVIPKGGGLPAIAGKLEDAGLVDSAWLFMAQVALAGNPPLRAGEYAFPAHASTAEIIDAMHRGLVVEHKFTVAEGLTVHQVMALLDHAEALTGGLARSPPEGSLLPQTYFYVYGDGRDSVLTRMSAAMTQTLDTLWAARAPGLPITDKGQALTLASIVERETSVAVERPHVAAVYENRLRQRMRLEADPTVIYAASHGEGVLDHPITRDELALASPYNTYANEGLPPGPICNPGRASIEAVLHPATSDDLYFVADGSGGHIFAKTIAEHNKNVEHWRQIEKAK